MPWMMHLDVEKHIVKHFWTFRKLHFIKITNLFKCFELQNTPCRVLVFVVIINSWRDFDKTLSRRLHNFMPFWTFPCTTPCWTAMLGWVPVANCLRQWRIRKGPSEMKVSCAINGHLLSVVWRITAVTDHAAAVN